MNPTNGMRHSARDCGRVNGATQPNTNPTASTPQTATGGPGGGISFGTKPFGRNAGKPGSGGMPPEALRNIMEYAGRTAGVNTEIFAGIEPGHHRHGVDRMSGGIGSADVTLRDPTTGQTLDFKEAGGSGQDGRLHRSSGERGWHRRRPCR